MEVWKLALSLNIFLISKWYKTLVQDAKFGHKGLQRQRLIGSAGAGFNHARTITNAPAKGLDARQDDYDKGICSPGSLVNNLVR